MDNVISQNTQYAIWYLQQIQPSPWHICSFDPPRFHTLETPELLAAHIEDRSGSDNLYYHLNQLSGEPKKGKARKSDISACNALHVDLDFKDLGWAPDQPLDTVWGIALDRVSRLPLRPTFIVFTGGGFHLIWQLRAPYAIEGLAQNIDQVESRNHALALAVGADPSTRDICRVLRVPFTLNLPNEKKRQAGRQPVMSCLVEYDVTRLYELDQFEAYETSQNSAQTAVELPATVTKAESDAVRDRLPEGIRKALDKLGKAKPDGTIDRSEACYHTLVLLFENGLTERDAFAVMSFAPVAAKYIENGTLAKEVTRVKRKHDQKCALRSENRSIGNAVPYAPLPEAMTLDDMTNRLVFVAHGSMVADYQTGAVMAFTDIKRKYKLCRTNFVTNAGETRDLETFEAWLSSPKRMTVDLLTWNPRDGKFCKAPERINGMEASFNLWNGLQTFTPTWGEDYFNDLLQRFLDHVAYLVPVEAERNHFLQWLAHIVQRPGELPHTAYVMIATSHGIGRSWLGSVLTRVLRGHVAAGLDLSRILDSEFNGPLSQKLLCIIEEAHEGFDHRRYDRGKMLRRLITEDTRIINQKHEKAYAEVNCMRWLMFSNYDDALPIENSDRRFVYIENPSKCKSEAYYEELYGLVNEPAFLSVVRQYLGELDLSGFNPGAHAPWNNIKRRALDSMTSELEQHMQDYFQTWPGDFTTASSIREYAQRNMGDDRKIDSRHFQNALKRCGFVSSGIKMRMNGKRSNLMILRNIDPETLRNASPEVIIKHLNKWEFDFLKILN